jgi:hypothetical protein
MPEIRPEDHALNQKIETEVLTAMVEEEGNMPINPRAKKPSIQVESAHVPSRRSNRSVISKGSKFSTTGSESPTVETKSFLPPALVTPEVAHPKAPVSSTAKSSGSNRRCIYPSSNTYQQGLMDLAPPLMPRSFSNHSLMSENEYHSDDRISFEGQHFHYLDSFAIHEVTKAPPAPEPMFIRRSGPPSRYSSTISLPQLTATISDEDLSADTQFTELAKSNEALSFNPNVIFSGEGERGSWSIDIDREFLLMEE